MCLKHIGLVYEHLNFEFTALNVVLVEEASDLRDQLDHTSASISVQIAARDDDNQVEALGMAEHPVNL